MSLPLPTDCAYAPPGEYIKDHTFVKHDGWYHLFSISGTQGYYHGYNGNEETLSWSISRDLVNWEFRGHVLHASQWPGAFDQHEVWAPFCLPAPEGFYLFYTGIVHPHRPMEYRRLGHQHPWVFEGHRETQGLAFSRDLTHWDKIADFEKGLEVPGRDSHVVRDEANNRWLLYSTLGIEKAHVSESSDLKQWKPLGVCAQFPETVRNGQRLNTAESLTVMKHPLNGRWIMLGNWHYLVSDDPVRFEGEARPYDCLWGGRALDLGFAGEMLFHDGRWYRSGTLGEPDHWKLGFFEIEWQPDAAFKVVRPSVIVATG